MKIAVVFPGIGYHADKPLLYYSKEIATQCGFEVKTISYGGFASGIRGKEKEMLAAFQSALRQSEDVLRGVDFSKYETILFLSKSIGTAVAAAFAEKRQIQTANVFYTPVETSFQVMKDPGIVFHGTADPWMEQERFLGACEKAGYPYYLTEGGNHSLETGDVRRDLEQLQTIMKQTEEYIRSL